LSEYVVDELSWGLEKVSAKHSYDDAVEVIDRETACLRVDFVSQDWLADSKVKLHGLPV
jgi:hypothetical protein